MEGVAMAMIDGASFFQIFRRIMLPNSLPIIVVTVIYQFTNIWNDFLFASAYAGTGESMPMHMALGRGSWVTKSGGTFSRSSV